MFRSDALSHIFVMSKSFLSVNAFAPFKKQNTVFFCPEFIQLTIPDVIIYSLQIKHGSEVYVHIQGLARGRKQGQVIFVTLYLLL